MAQTLETDGTADFLGGQDASKIPSKVPSNCYFAGVNIQISKGVPGPRWAFIKRKPLPPEGEFTNRQSNLKVPYAEIFSGGRYQAAIPYAIGGTKYVIIVISGLIYLININTWETKIITIQGGGTLNENAPRINWSNAGSFLVLFDFPNVPVIFDGVTARRSNLGLFEVPVSTLGAYNQNRLAIANAGNEFTLGDPSGSSATPNAPVTFTEVEAPAAPYFGQIFQLPTNYLSNLTDPITAMTFLQVTDVSTGIGPLLVATKNQIYTFQTQNPRVSWENGAFGSLFVNQGIAGSRAFINVNSDVFVLSGDGQVRTLAMSRDEQSKWSKVPISREVENYLIYHDESLMGYSVLGYFNNKVFISANPFRTKCFGQSRQQLFDVAFAGMVVIGLDNLATLGKQGTPAWDGLWTGVRPMDMFQVDNRFFIMSKDELSRNEIYEVDPSQTIDRDGADTRQVTSILYTKEYDFKNQFQNRTLHSIDLGFNEVQGDFEVNVDFRPSFAANFVRWGSFVHKAPWRNCKAPFACLYAFAKHGFRALVVGDPVDGNACDLVSKMVYRTLRKVQLKFTITGKYWELQDYRLKAIPLPQSEQETACQEYYDVPVCKQCNNDWEIKPFKSCQHLKT